MSFKGVNILIADEEDPVTAKILSKNLLKAGFDVSFFSNGEQALKELKTKKFDLLITGIKSSTIDGLELLRRVKVFNHPTEVIIYTEYGDVDNYVKATKLGAADFINKPMEFNEFLSVIAGVIESKTQKTKIAVTDRRKYPRVPINEPAFIIQKKEYKNKRAKNLVKLINLSLSGMLIEYPAPLEIDKVLEIHPILGGEKIKTLGKVRRSESKKQTDTEVFHTGIELTKISDRNQKVLGKYIYRYNIIGYS